MNKEYIINTVLLLMVIFLNKIVLTLPITAVNKALSRTTAYIKNVMSLEPSAPDIKRDEIIIILAKLPRIRVDKLKFERFNVISTPKFSFLNGFTKEKYILKIPNILLTAKPITELKLIKG